MLIAGYDTQLNRYTIEPLSYRSWYPNHIDRCPNQNLYPDPLFNHIRMSLFRNFRVIARGAAVFSGYISVRAVQSPDAYPRVADADSNHAFVEYRIPLPMTIEEFHRAQLYMVAEKSLKATNTSGGVEWIANAPFDNTDGHWGMSPITGIEVPRTQGQYTLKRYHLKSKFPAAVAAMMPSSAMYLVEEAWNAYPHTRTVLVSTYFDHAKFHVVS